MLNSISIAPIAAIVGEIAIPGDKSISHRALIIGAMADGRSTFHHWLAGEDCLATFNCLKAMGVSIRHRGDTIEVDGVGLFGFNAPLFPLDCGNSGTTLRLMAGVLAAQPFSTELTGDASLLRRPMRRVTEPLHEMGALVYTAPQGTAPLYVEGGQTLRGVSHTLAVPSAQVKSAILLAGIMAEGTTSLLEPIKTRDHTERMLQAMGYPLVREESTLSLEGGHTLSPMEFTIPADISSAAFFIVAATLLPGSEITIRGMGVNPTRTGIITLLQAMGADITLSNVTEAGHEPVADCTVRHAKLHGIDILPEQVVDAIDEMPILFIAASVAEGVTTLSGAMELRYKESDRLAVMAAGLQALGCDASVTEDGIHIQGGALQRGEVNCAGDHRVAMAFAIAGAVGEGVTLHGADAIATSFPDFMTLLHQHSKYR